MNDFNLSGHFTSVKAEWPSIRLRGKTFVGRMCPLPLPSAPFATLRPLGRGYRRNACHCVVPSDATHEDGQADVRSRAPIIQAVI